MFGGPHEKNRFISSEQKLHMYQEAVRGYIISVAKEKSYNTDQCVTRMQTLAVSCLDRVE